jgi:hypothetical protein
VIPLCLSILLVNRPRMLVPPKFRHQQGVLTDYLTVVSIALGMTRRSDRAPAPAPDPAPRSPGSQPHSEPERGVQPAVLRALSARRRMFWRRRTEHPLLIRYSGRVSKPLADPGAKNGRGVGADQSTAGRR